jgi:hypothetical protein
VPARAGEATERRQTELNCPWERLVAVARVALEVPAQLAKNHSELRSSLQTHGFAVAGRIDAAPHHRILSFPSTAPNN